MKVWSQRNGHDDTPGRLPMPLLGSPDMDEISDSDGIYLISTDADSTYLKGDSA